MEEYKQCQLENKSNSFNYESYVQGFEISLNQRYKLKLNINEKNKKIKTKNMEEKRLWS